MLKLHFMCIETTFHVHCIHAQNNTKCVQKSNKEEVHFMCIVFMHKTIRSACKSLARRKSGRLCAATSKLVGEGQDYILYTFASTPKAPHVASRRASPPIGAPHRATPPPIEAPQPHVSLLIATITTMKALPPPTLVT